MVEETELLKTTVLEARVRAFSGDETYLNSVDESGMLEGGGFPNGLPLPIAQAGGKVANISNTKQRLSACFKELCFIFLLPFSIQFLVFVSSRPTFGAPKEQPKH
jgi:hypothetical protein